MRAVFYSSRLDSYSQASIFLAGPTARSRPEGDITEWRRKALSHLQIRKFDGDVFFPEPEPGRGVIGDTGTESQIKWEREHLEQATCICFWIPRELKEMPAFTTNIEWGMWCDSDKVVLGYPENAPKMGHIIHYARRLGVPMAYTLGETLDLAMVMAQEFGRIMDQE